MLECFWLLDQRFSPTLSTLTNPERDRAEKSEQISSSHRGFPPRRETSSCSDISPTSRLLVMQLNGDFSFDNRKEEKRKKITFDFVIVDEASVLGTGSGVETFFFVVSWR